MKLANAIPFTAATLILLAVGLWIFSGIFQIEALSGIGGIGFGLGFIVLCVLLLSYGLRKAYTWFRK